MQRRQLRGGLRRASPSWTNPLQTSARAFIVSKYSLTSSVHEQARDPSFRRGAAYHHGRSGNRPGRRTEPQRSEEHTSELQSLMRISYAVFCLKKKKT